MFPIFLVLVRAISVSGEYIEQDYLLPCECVDGTSYCGDAKLTTWPYHQAHVFPHITVLDLSKNNIQHSPTVDIRIKFPAIETFILTGNEFPCYAIHYLEKSSRVISDCQGIVLLIVDFEMHNSFFPATTTDQPTRTCPFALCGTRAGTLILCTFNLSFCYLRPAFRIFQEIQPLLGLAVVKI